MDKSQLSNEDTLKDTGSMSFMPCKETRKSDVRDTAGWVSLGVTFESQLEIDSSSGSSQ